MASRSRGSRALLAAVPVALAAASCATSALTDVYSAADADGHYESHVFFAGAPIYCVAKGTTARSDALPMEFSLQPIEVAGKRVALPPRSMGGQPTGKGQNVLNFDVTSFLETQAPQAFLDPPNQRVVTAPDAVDDPTAVALAQDIHDTLLDHMNNAAVHKGHVDPTVALMPPNCTTISNQYDTSNCALMMNALKALFARHIGDSTYHTNTASPPVEADDAVVPDAPPSTNPPPPLPLVEVSMYPLLNDFKTKLMDHIMTVQAPPPVTPAHYRCIVKYDDEVKSTDFVILPTPYKPPPPTSPSLGQCNEKNVVFCPDPNPNNDPNNALVRCCTFDTANCGFGPRGTNICYEIANK